MEGGFVCGVNAMEFCTDKIKLIEGTFLENGLNIIWWCLRCVERWVDDPLLE